MYNLESIANDQATFRACVTANEPYRPLYVKIKLIWRCNLRCQICNYWRQERHNALSSELLTLFLRKNVGGSFCALFHNLEGYGILFLNSQ